MLVLEALKRWDDKTEHNDQRCVCVSTAKQGKRSFLYKQWVETAEPCLIRKVLSSGYSPSWDTWGENGARALPRGLVQLWVSSRCCHGSVPIKEMLPLAGLPLLRSPSLLQGSELSSAALVPRWTRSAERLGDVAGLTTWLPATAAGPFQFSLS